ncbi:uncharacterized protein LOC104903047 [Beta vulgaris subsp. vulgaris]|uniref:uncharacterized protein LOC104903047 n=1 Tax=Beta vulgaris subsp. vulgaris TaxID=3555 RepID=UPI002549948B|nr:uncharacterized protein LOC104903047 [Beta vulgaris subsp. vulgaris]
MDNVRGMNIDQYKLVEVNHTKKYPKFDPFVLSYQDKGKVLIDAPVDFDFLQETSVGTPTLSDPSDIPDYEEGDDEEESSFESGDSEDDDDEDDDPGAPESLNLGSQTQRDDSQARDIGDHVPETPSSQREEAEGSNRASKRVLSPTGLWFDDNKVSGSITDIFQGHFREPWFNYSEVDDATRTHWWNSFMALYEWAPKLDGQVRKAYLMKAGNRLRDLRYWVLNKAKERPKWLGNTIYETMKKKSQELAFLEKSEKAKKNRRGGSLSNPVEPSHFQGSISAAQHAKKMAKSIGAVLPTAPELFLKTHLKIVAGKGEIAANKKAKQISETYNKKLDECTTQES